jgi:phi13 family phage major tail protein
MALFVIGVDMAHYAKVLNDNPNPPGATPQPPEYGPVTALYDLREVGVNSSDSFLPVFADNMAKATVSSKSEKTLALTRFSFSPEEKVSLLGWIKTASGKFAETADSLPCYIALGFRIRMNDDSFVYVWLFKGKLAINQTSAQTKENTISPQFAPAVGTFVVRECDRAYQINQPGDDAFAATWFTLATLQELVEDDASAISGVSLNIGTIAPLVEPAAVIKARTETAEAIKNFEAIKAEAEAAIAAAQAREESAIATAVAEAAKAEADKLTAETKPATPATKNK